MPRATPSTDEPPVDGRSLDAWTRQIMANMHRMSNDEKYRRQIARQLS